MINEAVLFLLGFVLGAAVVYFMINKRANDDIASYVQNQQSEKQKRKDRILVMIREKGNVSNNDVETAFSVSDASATNYLQELEREGQIEQVGGRGRFVSYQIKK